MRSRSRQAASRRPRPRANTAAGISTSISIVYIQIVADEESGEDGRNWACGPSPARTIYPSVPSDRTRASSSRVWATRRPRYARRRACEGAVIGLTCARPLRRRRHADGSPGGACGGQEVRRRLAAVSPGADAGAAGHQAGPLDIGELGETGGTGQGSARAASGMPAEECWWLTPLCERMLGTVLASLKVFTLQTDIN